MAVNLRTKPIDRRRLSTQDKSDYNMVRSRKIAGARARRGADEPASKHAYCTHQPAPWYRWLYTRLKLTASTQQRRRCEGETFRITEAYKRYVAVRDLSVKTYSLLQGGFNFLEPTEALLS